MNAWKFKKFNRVNNRQKAPDRESYKVGLFSFSVFFRSYINGHHPSIVIIDVSYTYKSARESRHFTIPWQKSTGKWVLRFYCEGLFICYPPTMRGLLCYVIHIKDSHHYVFAKHTGVGMRGFGVSGLIGKWREFSTLEIIEGFRIQEL